MRGLRIAFRDVYAPHPGQGTAEGGEGERGREKSEKEREKRREVRIRR